MTFAGVISQLVQAEAGGYAIQSHTLPPWGRQERHPSRSTPLTPIWTSGKESGRHHAGTRGDRPHLGLGEDGLASIPRQDLARRPLVDDPSLL